MVKQINLKVERRKVEAMIEKRLPSMSYVNWLIFNEIFRAEKNDNGLSDCTPEEAEHDSKRNAAYAQKGIKKAIKEAFDHHARFLAFDIINERIKSHYEKEFLKDRIEELKAQIKRTEERLYHSLR